MGVRPYKLLFRTICDRDIGKFCWNSDWFRNMSSSVLDPPSAVRGMTILDKGKFDKTVRVGLIVIPTSALDSVRQFVKPYLLKMPNFRPLQDLPCAKSENKVRYCDELSKFEGSCKIAVLDPASVNNFDDIDCRHRDNLKELGIDRNNFVFSHLKLSFDNWPADVILRSVIPAELDSVSSYSICGHIVHVNLREVLSDYKELIGRVLLEKVVNARTVVNKTDNIDSTFRTFKMELLCGDDDFIATVKENGSTFKFDFSKVYWNSRLSTEHERIVRSIDRGDIVYDVFCGVGPFSVPAAKKKCRVLANDLNPESVEWLKENRRMNKVHLEIFNKDGKDFIKDVVKNDLLKIDKDFDNRIHIIMNLPGLAVEFLPCFVNLFDKEKPLNAILPIVHVYCFVKGSEDPKSEALRTAQDKLGVELGDDLDGVFFVRNVAPMKEMMRVSFKLSERITCSSTKRGVSDEDEPTKRLCIDKN